MEWKCHQRIVISYSFHKLLVYEICIWNTATSYLQALAPQGIFSARQDGFRPFPALSISAKEFPAVYPLFATETQLGSTFPLATQAFRERVEGWKLVLLLPIGVSSNKIDL